jgi:[ribosomal protein S18]-alanine N-acetyltransferase
VVVGEVRLRPATQADVAAIGEVFFNSFWSNYEELEPGSRDHPGYIKYVSEKSRRIFSSTYQTITIAEHDRSVVGFCLHVIEPAEIYDLWVAPDHQGKGIGTALIENAFTILTKAGASSVEIDTHQRNAKAIRLYQRMGFAIDHYEPRFSVGLQRDVPIVNLKKPL